MTKLEEQAIEMVECPRENCRAPQGAPCRRMRGLYHQWVSQTFKHPHAERVTEARELISDQGGNGW